MEGNRNDGWKDGTATGKQGIIVSFMSKEFSPLTGLGLCSTNSNTKY